jgi:hypothetical protein
MGRRVAVSVLLLCGALAAAEPDELAADAVRVLWEQKAGGPDLVEYAYTLECRAGGVAPSLRVTLGQGSEFNASAGVAMPIDAQDRATATLVVRVQVRDKAEGTYAISVDVGPGGPTTLGRVLHLQPGQDLASIAALRQPSATSPFRHAIALGNVGGSMLSVYVMPGRSGTRTSPLGNTPPAGNAAAAATEAFRTWAAAVKRGDAEQIGAVVPAAEWAGMNPEQKAQRLKEYQDAFTTVLGDGYAPEQFSVEYAGGATFGKLKVRYGDKVLPDLNARYIGGRWVLTEP